MFIRDRPEPAVQKSGNDAGPSASIPAPSFPGYLEKVRPLTKAQPKAVNNTE
jgi:hypothetical protein